MASEKSLNKKKAEVAELAEKMKEATFRIEGESNE